MAATHASLVGLPPCKLARDLSSHERLSTSSASGPAPARAGYPTNRQAVLKSSKNGRLGRKCVTKTPTMHRCRAAAAQVVEAPSSAAAAAPSSKSKAPKVLIAGGGIGGLTLARALQKKGVEVTVFEKVKEYKPFGGPIQLQCNAIGTLEAIDMELANRVYDNCAITGDRINGLMDGITGEWFFRFDTRQPCYENGLPLTLVINRYKFLELLVESVGKETVYTGGEVVDYREDDDGVTAILSNGEEVRGDILIGADGIRSKVRQAMHKGERSPLAYSGYTVFTATCDFTGKLTDTSRIGYQVYLGPEKYFVASDVGQGKQQWYAFRLQKPGIVEDRCPKELLTEYFQDWHPALKERIECTLPEDIEQRDVFDVVPSISPFTWSKGRVALLGDAVHAVQPNLGQGGGQAIESAYTLADQIAGLESSDANSVRSCLRGYSSKRILRAGVVHGLSRMLGLLNVVYRRYLGSFPYPFYPEFAKSGFEQLAKLKLTHPGRVIGQIAMMGSMKYILEYIGSGFNAPQALGGAPITVANIKGERAVCCAVPGIGAPKRPLTDEDFRMKGIPGISK